MDRHSWLPPDWLWNVFERGVGEFVRVITGAAGGRKLVGGSTAIRPTSERVRTSLFDSLAAWLEGRSTLDLCAGTGSLGIEALSRGASQAVFVDHHPAAIRTIHDNLTRCRFSQPTAVWPVTAVEAIQHLERNGCVVDLILADPPYDSMTAGEILTSVDVSGILSANGLLIIENRKKDPLPFELEHLTLLKRREIGDTALSFYHRVNTPTNAPMCVAPAELPPPRSRFR